MPDNILSMGATYTSMIKKLTGIILVLIIAVVQNGSVFASAGQHTSFFLTPDDILYDTVLAIEMAQYSLTENPGERLMILEESAEKLIMAIDNTEDPGTISILVGQLQRDDSLLWDLWDELDDKQGGELAPRFIELAEKRLQRLEVLIENEKIPYRARENMKKAFLKQQESFKKQENVILIAESSRNDEDGPVDNMLVKQIEPNDTMPGQSGSAPGQSGSTPSQSSSAPGQSGSAPGQSGSAPSQSSSAPGQSGSAPGQSGSTPSQSSSAPGQSGSAPGQSGSAPGQSGSAPGH